MTKAKKSAVWTLSIIAFILILHISLPFILVRYVNKTLEDIPGYTGSVSWIHVNLFRGAYQIHDLEILKEQGEFQEPFVSTESLDLSLEWSALFHGEIVGELVFSNPELIFINSPGTESEDQNGADVNWTEPIKELMPLQINRLELINGSIYYKDPHASPQVDIYFRELHALASNLSNVNDQTVDLPSDLRLSAISIGNGQLELTGGLNIIKESPDFDIDLKFENVDLTALNDFLLAYANADLAKGTLNFYSEITGKDGQLTGYVKPLMTNLKFLNWKQDKKHPIKLFWEAIVGTVSEVFENQKEDQFATKVPITGQYADINPDLWNGLGSILKNAFVSALKNDTDDSIDIDDLQKHN